VSIAVNPVIGRELTERLRGFRSYLAVGLFVAALALTVFLVFEGSQTTISPYDLGSRTSAGRLVFESVILIMTVLVLFFVPALTAGAIAGERERQTLATLQVTMLRTRSILFGKIVSALVFLVLMIVAALPVLAVAYLLGGLRLLDVVIGVVAVIVVAVLVATMVVAVSSFAKRVQTATLLAYGFTAMVTLIGPLAYAIANVLKGDSPGAGTAPAWIVTVSPVSLVADLGSGNRASGDGPLTFVRQWIGEAKARSDESWWAWFPETFDWDRLNQASAAGRPLGPGPAAWVLSAVALALVAAVLVVLALRHLRTPAQSER
jgi:ABC-type transport system involved in multi-copper enzyme maturation permease subunit